MFTFKFKPELWRIEEILAAYRYRIHSTHTESYFVPRPRRTPLTDAANCPEPFSYASNNIYRSRAIPSDCRRSVPRPNSVPCRPHTKRPNQGGGSRHMVRSRPAGRRTALWGFLLAPRPPLSVRPAIICNGDSQPSDRSRALFPRATVLYPPSYTDRRSRHNGDRARDRPTATPRK